jgi:TatD DNase family protein
VEARSTWIDSHAHLQQIPAAERTAVLDRARAAGIGGFLVPATRLDEADDLLDLASSHEDVWCALGIHPHDASTWQDGDFSRLRALVDEPKVVAVGECGLDFHYDQSPRDVQEEVLRHQFRIALEAGLPVIVHNRESDDRMLAIVKEPEFTRLTGDFHSFAGAPTMLEELRDRGFYFGFSGMVTFAKADNIRALLALVPDDRVLVETDTPFLAPTPHRGKPNRPEWAALVGDRVARERGWDADAARRRTTANFFNLFAKARPGA